MKLSNRLALVQPSKTLEISAKAKEMQASGIDVVSLAAGEPDFMPPDAVHDAACAAIRAGAGRYTQTAGTPALRRAIAARVKTDHGLDYDIGEILVTNGAKQAIFNAIYVTADPGDEVIIPTPYWTSYPEMAQALQVKPVFLHTSPKDGFRLHGAALEKLVTPRTRALLLNSPNNPTGALISRAELEEVAAIARRGNFWIITDDIYEKLVFNGKKALNILAVAPDLRERTIVVNGLSKTYCMTGWRVGYAHGPRAIIRDLEVIQGHSTSCANAIAQAAALTALTKIGPEHITMMVREYERRAAAVHARLVALPGIRLADPVASFYLFPTVEDVFGKRFKGKPITSSLDFCRILLEDFHVAAVPGEAFGATGSFRMSFACSMEELDKAVTRIESMFAALD